MNDMNGTVKQWELERGYGWFRVSNGRDYFCHIKNWLEADAPTVGREVEFEVGPGFNGKKEQAVNARYMHAGADALKAGV
jgi:cold shock CspA family protein